MGGNFMITKEMIKNGLNNKIITIEDDCYGCVGICCKIGDMAFCFLGDQSDDLTKEEYWKSYTVDETTDMLFDILKDEKSADEHGLDDYEVYYYENMLQ